MQSLDMIFFEEFKRLEAVCNDMFSCKSGVTEYITQMEQAAEKGRSAVPGWDGDYKSLKHLRWVRNKIAHEADAGAVCTQGDLSQLRSMTAKFQSKQDPLAMLEKARKPKPAASKPKPAAGSQPKKATPANREKPAAQTRPKQPEKKPQGKRAGAVILLILVVLLVLAGMGALYLDVSGRMSFAELGTAAADLFRELPEKIRMLFQK